MIEYGGNDSLNYVTLGLKKYNELYDKAKMLDELKAKFGNDLEGYIEKAFDALKNILSDFDVEKCKENEGNHIPTIDSNVDIDIPEEQRNTFKVGDKVELIEKNNECNNGFEIGDKCEIKEINYNIDPPITIIKPQGEEGYAYSYQLKKINESEEN